MVEGLGWEVAGDGVGAGEWCGGGALDLDAGDGCGGGDGDDEFLGWDVGGAGAAGVGGVWDGEDVVAVLGVGGEAGGVEGEGDDVCLVGGCGEESGWDDGGGGHGRDEDDGHGFDGLLIIRVG